MKRSLVFLLFILFALNGFAQDKVKSGVKQKIDAYLQKATANGWAGSVLVAQKGEILLEKGYGLADRESKRPQTAQTIFSIGSITKQFTGAAILKLEMQDKLSTNDLITKYFQNVPADKKNITLHHLLTHSAGFPGAIGDDYENINSLDFIKRAFQTPLLFQPGEQYEYSNVGFSLLGIIIEQLSGKSYDGYLYENIFKPAGMEQTGYLHPKHQKDQLAVGYRDGQRWGTALDRAWLADGPGWHLRANGGILSTVHDMYKWSIALKNNTVLSEAAKQKYFTPHIKEYEDGNSYYGYGWVVQKSPANTTMIWHNGGNSVYNAIMSMDLEEDIIIIVSSNIAGKVSDNYALKINDILHGNFLDLDEKLVAQYQGTYQLPSGAKIQVSFNENNELITQFDEAEVLKLLVSSDKEGALCHDCEKYDQQVHDILTKILKDDFSALAAAWNDPLAAVQKRAQPFWTAQKEKYGEAKKVEILGTFKRPVTWITFAKIHFAKAPLYMMYVWENGQLADVRDMPVVDKIFEMQSETRFFAPNNKKTLVFTKGVNGKMELQIHGDKLLASAGKVKE